MQAGTIQNNAALLILQQTAASSRREESASATGATDPAVLVQVALQPTASQSKISEAMFSVNHTDVTKLKLELIERTGKALGVKEDDYGSREEFTAALERAAGHLMLEAGPTAFAELEKSLGLDELGITLDDVIQSARDPQKNDRVTKALSAYLGSSMQEERISAYAGPDDLGLYSVHGG